MISYLKREGGTEKERERDIQDVKVPYSSRTRTKKKIGGQHHRVDIKDLERQSEEDQGHRERARTVCQIQ